MQYTRLGNTGLIISRLAFGAMTFGSQPDHPMAHVFNTPEKTADALVGRSLDAGINFFDTADAYANGQSEQILGRALKPRRADVIISTKVGFRSGPAVTRAGASYGYVISATEASLKRLGTDYIDLLSIHRLDPYTPLEETARALDNLVQRGLVRYVGYSNFSAWQSAKCLGIQERHNYSRFVAAQMYYSLVGRDIEYEIAPFCADAGIGIVVWSPLAGGFLTGRYTRQDPTGGSGRLAYGDFLPIDRERAWDVIERMHAIGDRRRASVAQVALAWLLAKPFVSTILLGASKMSQLEDNLGAPDVELTAAEVAELDKVTEPVLLYPNWFHTRTADQVSGEALGLVPREEKKPAAD
ncbi:MAG TPA: aldo/keto reductase [Terriglobales bacterium]|nr:aldo/keto reductase [Terriglobales bacterium]